jgi:phospholipid/cholesterol/gamma-HCH transport system substrate-binding protein
MKNSRSLEIGTGLFVLLGFAALFFLTTQLPGSGLKFGAASGYKLTANFDNVGDLKPGSPVSMGGVRVGEVESIGYDSAEFKAVVAMRIESQFNRIPDDSDASIQTTGLLGGKYVGLTPGASETFFTDGGQIEITQSAIVLESLVNRFLANFASGRSDDSSNESPAAPSQNDNTSQETNNK